MTVPLARASIAAAASAAFAVAACDDDGKKVPTAPRSRSQGVVATASARPPAKPKPAATAAPHRRRLCDGQLDEPGRRLTDAPISREAAAGATEPPEAIPVGGEWTWINFWAAWCVPCREEMPRLLAWKKRLGSKGTPFRLVFVSIDDDERQLRGFLGRAPEDGVRSTYWLVEGTERETWLADVGLDVDPELPVHVLVDPDGKVRCRVQGAVEEGDFDRAAAILSGR